MGNIILFGPPGSGKGTQADFIVQRNMLTHISTGDIFRKNISQKTELGKLANDYMKKGQLVPDQLTINLLENELDLRSAIIGDSELVEFNDRLRLFAYTHPKDDHALTITRTKIKTIRKENIQSSIEKWVVNAELDYSATGGPVFNGGGELVGILIPEQYSLIAPVTQIRPLSVVKELIERTIQSSKTEHHTIPLFSGSTQKEIDFTENAWVGAPKFSDQASYTDNELYLTNYRNHFLEGTENIYFEYCLQNLGKNILIEERWYLDDILQDSLSASYVWNGEAFAIISDKIGVPSSSGLPSGNWKLEIWANRILHLSLIHI